MQARGINERQATFDYRHITYYGFAFYCTTAPSDYSESLAGCLNETTAGSVGGLLPSHEGSIISGSLEPGCVFWSLKVTVLAEQHVRFPGLEEIGMNGFQVE